MNKKRKYGIGLYKQINPRDYKHSIFDENGDSIPVSYDEYLAYMQDTSSEKVRRHSLGMEKSIRRGISLLTSVVEEMQIESNLETVNNIINKTNKMITTVKAKFQCNAIVDNPYGGKTATFHAVYGDSEENKSFSSATPSAHLSMHISEGRPAGEYFEQGKDYYLTFEAADGERD